jgi:hypothetical protein
MKKRYAIPAIFLGIIGVIVYFTAMFTGPHMIRQPHILSYEMPMPSPPPNAVPVEPNEKLPPAREQVLSMRNPLPATKENIEWGKTYYDYYCVFCHGETGQGNGPVGVSYMPRPSDLHDAKTLRKSDGELLYAMLTCIGHEPVLSRIIPVRQRWYLVLYTRTLARSAPSNIFINESNGRLD